MHPANEDLELTARDVDLIKQREGCVLKPYRDTKGIWTDGYGNTHGVVPNGPPITQEKADADFARHLVNFRRSVLACVNVPLKDHQLGALVSFALNVGGDALPHGANGGPSSILRALNAGDYEGAGNAFNNWMADPEVKTRRAGERDQFRGVAFEARRPV